MLYNSTFHCIDNISNIIHIIHYQALKFIESYMTVAFNPTALKKAIIVYNSGQSKCNRVNDVGFISMVLQVKNITDFL